MHANGLPARGVTITHRAKRVAATNEAGVAQIVAGRRYSAYLAAEPLQFLEGVAWVDAIDVAGTADTLEYVVRSRPRPVADMNPENYLAD